MKDWKILSIKAVVAGDKRRVPEGACVNGTGFELPCKYYTQAAKMHKETATKKKLAREEKNLMNYIQYMHFLLPFLKWAYTPVDLYKGGLIN